MRRLVLFVVLGIAGATPTAHAADWTRYSSAGQGALQINSSGVVAGSTERADGSSYAWRWSGPTGRTALEDLSCEADGGDRYTGVLGLTDDGRVVGEGRRCSTAGPAYTRNLVWAAGVTTPTDVGGGGDTGGPFIKRVSPSGRTAGFIQTCDADFHCTHSSAKGIVGGGLAPTGRSTYGIAVNQAGQILESDSAGNSFPNAVDGATISGCAVLPFEPLRADGKVVCLDNGSTAYVVDGTSRTRLPTPAGMSGTEPGTAGWTADSPIFGTSTVDGYGAYRLVEWAPPDWTPRVVPDTGNVPRTVRSVSSDGKWLLFADGDVFHRGDARHVLSGTVRTRAGGPVDGATVTVRRLDGIMDPVQARTGADGRYSIELDGHRYSATPTFPGGRDFKPTETQVDLTNVDVTADFTMLEQGLRVELAAFTPDGLPIEGRVAPGATVLVRLTVANDGDGDLHDLQLTGGAPLLVDARGTGKLLLASGPAPAFDAATLPAGATREYVYALAATVKGRAAVETKIGADDPDGRHLEATRSLRFDIDLAGDPELFTPELTRFAALGQLDRSLAASFRSYHDQLGAASAKLAKRLAKRFSAAERKKWFGADGPAVDALDLARANEEASAGAAMAVQFPKGAFKGYTADELQAAYDKTLQDEVGKGVHRWVKGWKDLGGAARKGLADTWSEALLSGRYVWGSATADERAQVEAMAVEFAGGVGSDTSNVFNTAVREIPRAGENLGYLAQASIASTKQVVGFPKTVIDTYADGQEKLLALADADPLEYQRRSAKLAADALNKGLPVIFDTLIGGGASRLAGAGIKAVKVARGGAATVELAEAAGAVTQGGKAAGGTATSFALDETEATRSLSSAEAAALADDGAFLSQNPGATLVQASDAGNVYRLPNLGGVPETALDAKATILGDLQREYAEKFGTKLELAEVLKPGTPYAKPGGVAKTELTAPKTGKPEMLDAGMPDAGLGEAGVWHNPVSPARGNPAFKTWPNARQKAALEAWDKANQEWAAWVRPEAGSKNARLRELIGKEGRVPLDPEPRNGIQRFAIAHYEEVVVKQGTGEARLLRVRKYVVQAVDARSGRVVNTRTVVDSPKALPQTPDADAVAVAKIVGRDAAGKPILAPLSRAEREFVLPRYINKNVAARRTGLNTGLAEHGATLIMDDASAKAAGYLLPSFGAGFLPASIGRAFLARIAKFVAPAGVSPEAMLQKMLDLVEANGGFGQHTVVVTSDSRFLGEVPFESW